MALISPRQYEAKKKIDARAVRWLIEFFEIEPAAVAGNARVYKEEVLDEMMDKLKKAKEKTHS